MENSLLFPRSWRPLFFSPAIQFYQRCCLAAAGLLPTGTSLCAGFHYVFSGGAAQPSMMLQPPLLTFAQERRLVAQRRDEPSSCENTAGARSSREKEKRCQWTVLDPPPTCTCAKPPHPHSLRPLQNQACTETRS